ncbi:MAG TPA: hypothetical protein VEW95_09195 [Candidatus Limnocylindrales bacterium]|nr:hypothetical protein [Candidatus Limnocylindrales bacterium]
MADTRGILDLDPTWFDEHPEEWQGAVDEIASMGTTGEEAAAGMYAMAAAIRDAVEATGGVLR